MAGRRIATEAVERLTSEGLALEGGTRRCERDHRDGTDLPGCVKCYLPPPEGPWRMVFVLRRRTPEADPEWLYLAFGRGHPTRTWEPSAYQIAGRRLHAG